MLPATDERNYSVQLLETLMDCDRFEAGAILDEAAKHLGTERVFNDIVPVTMNALGEKWANGEAALTQIYAASRIIEDAIRRLAPNLKIQSEINCKIVIGSLDYHGLGKNILTRFLKASGVEVIDLGTGVSPERFVETAIKNNVNAILVSALMFHTCLQAERVKILLNKKGVNIPMMVGGAPFNFDSDLWKKVGADAVGSNACETFIELKEMLKK
jgi:trimethylamine corrinoid protein